MHMTFYWGKTVTLLFDFWRTDSWLSYAFTLLACFIFSIFYQYLEDRRLRFKLISSGSPQAGGDSTTTPLLVGTKGGKWSAGRILGAALFGVNSGIGYFLMLAIMSFNGGVFVAVVLGLAVGYFVFRSGEEDVMVVDSPCACA